MSSVNATYQGTTQIVGQGFGAGGVPVLQDTASSTPPSTNAPGMQQYTLNAGLNQLLMPPSGFAFSRVQFLPLTTGPSSNIKSFTDSTGTHTALPGWTAGSVTVPAVPGGSIYIFSIGGETLAAAFS